MQNLMNGCMTLEFVALMNNQLKIELERLLQILQPGEHFATPPCYRLRGDMNWLRKCAAANHPPQSDVVTPDQAQDFRPAHQPLDGRGACRFFE